MGVLKKNFDVFYYIFVIVEIGLLKRFYMMWCFKRESNMDVLVLNDIILLNNFRVCKLGDYGLLKCYYECINDLCVGNKLFIIINREWMFFYISLCRK